MDLFLCCCERYGVWSRAPLGKADIYLSQLYVRQLILDAHVAELQLRLHKEWAGRHIRGFEMRDVRFGSLADICSAKRNVRFTPESDIDCVFQHVCFGPKADMAKTFCRISLGRRERNVNPFARIAS